MKNLLFISSCPFPLDKGSNQHAFFFLKALVAHFNVYCVFFLQPGHNFPDDIKGPLGALGVKDYDICRFSFSRKRGRLSAALRRIVAYPSQYMDLATTSGNLAKVENFIIRHGIDIVHIEHFHYAKYALRIPPDLKKAIVYHDLYHTIYSQKARLERRVSRKILLMIDCWKYYIFQRHIDAHVDLKVFLNQNEMKELPEKAVHIPHVVNQRIVFRKPRKTDFINLLFIGTYKHPPNVMSVEYIIKRLLPLLAKHTDQFRIRIVGSGTEKLQPIVDSSQWGKFVTIRGFINDINEAFNDIDIALFPILYGGGIKTKIIDAMAAGIPVVTTPEGVYGLHRLPDDSIGVGETADELVEQVFLLMGSYPQRLSRSRAGWRYVEEQFSYEAFLCRVKNTYQRLSLNGDRNFLIK